MRKEFIPEHLVPLYSDIFDLCPWAAQVVEVEGGYMAFESLNDAELFENNL